jgi:hypothetical protein
MQERIRTARSLTRHITNLVAIPLVVLTLLGLWRDEGLSGVQPPRSFDALIELLRWEYWAIATLIVALILLFEAAHRQRLALEYDPRFLSDILDATMDAHRGVNPYLCVILGNSGREEIQDCKAKLESLEFFDRFGALGEPEQWLRHDGLRAIYLHWAFGQANSDTTSIAIGGTATFDLVTHERGDNVFMVTAEERLRQAHPVPKGLWRFACTIEARSFHVASLRGQFEFGPDPEVLGLDTLRFRGDLVLDPGATRS